MSDLFLAVLWEVYDTEEELPPDDEPERKEQADASLPRDAVPATRAVRLLRAVVALRDVVEDEEEDPRLRKCAPAAARLLSEGTPRSDGTTRLETLAARGRAAARPPQLPRAAARVAVRALVQSSCFGQCAVGLILLNTALMMCEFHGMPEWLSAQLEGANLVLTMSFLAEMVLKLVALGGAVYLAVCPSGARTPD